MNAVRPLVVRDDFPILARPMRGGQAFVYLDSGATAQRPRAVLDAMVDFDTRSNGAVKRGSHLLAEESTVAYEEARAKVAAFIGAAPQEIVWTSGSTQSLNLLAYAISNATAGRGWGNADRFLLRAGDEIVVTRAEHHANLLPWQELCERTGARLTWLDLDSEGRIDPATLAVIGRRTRIVAFTHVSNVTGAVSPVAQIVEAAHAVGAFTVLDACQSVPHLPVNVRELDVDFAAFSGHKMYGPTGVGALYGREELLADLPPYQFGGSMIERVTMEKTRYARPPARFEAGSQPVTQIVGLARAVDYLSAIGMENVARYEDELTAQLLSGLAQIPGIRVLGPSEGTGRTGIAAFTVDGVHPHDVGQFLDARGIAVRVGHHCAQPIHDFFGVPASVRASVGIYTTSSDIDAFLDALSQVRGYFRVEGYIS
ncbi:aminotransferase class V-fold PLP-dependent enzyme [Actinotignum sp. GS-2025a]|uniref:aminotransferase class V-fold PLP-dependent enzyme n=1 Tax=unclassified Actinotignum TaxID=2632702 RepID=UPI003F4635EB